MTGTLKVYKRSQQGQTDILLLTSEEIILVFQDQANKSLFSRDAFRISVEPCTCMNCTFCIKYCLQTQVLSAGNHNTKTAQTQ